MFYQRVYGILFICPGSRDNYLILGKSTRYLMKFSCFVRPLSTTDLHVSVMHFHRIRKANVYTGIIGMYLIITI